MCTSFNAIDIWNCLRYLAVGIGVPWNDAFHLEVNRAKVVLNEFVAYLDLTTIIKAGGMSAKGMMITYALCGFANFLQSQFRLAGLVLTFKEKDIAALGLKAV